MWFRRINLGTFEGDGVWMGPGASIPQAVPRLRATAQSITFAIDARESTEDGAGQAEMGALTVDAWLGLVVDGRVVSRHSSLIEHTGTRAGASLGLVEEDVVPGQLYVLHLDFEHSGSPPPAVWVGVVSGAVRA